MHKGIVKGRPRVEQGDIRVSRPAEKAPEQLHSHRPRYRRGTETVFSPNDCGGMAQIVWGNHTLAGAFRQKLRCVRRQFLAVPTEHLIHRFR